MSEGLNEHPYAELTPDAVLDALASVGVMGDGRLLSLNSYENRVYLVYLDPPFQDIHHQIVVKFYRPNRWEREQILEEHSFSQELFDAEVPVVAPLLVEGQTLNEFKGFMFSVSPRCGGRTPELESPAVLHWIGRFIARLHVVGRTRPFATRPTLNLDTFGIESRDYLLTSGMIPPELVASWRAIVEQALDSVRSGFAKAGEVNLIRLHGDCHPGNILWNEARGNQSIQAGPHFVDLDDARMGPAIQDLWMLLSGDVDEMRGQMKEILKGYEDFLEFDDRELHLIEPLRTLRLIHYSAWIARRWSDPAFPAAFPWFNTQRYWQDRILELREQVGLMNS
jgi:Ser/Thr protein kinase RdoA (MazF antagonist)